MDRLYVITIEYNRFLEELTKMSGLLMKVRNEIQSFWYPYMLAEEVQLLDLKIKGKDVALTFSHAKLSKIEVALAYETQAFNSFRKWVEELEMSLNEALEGWKKAQDNL